MWLLNLWTPDLKLILTGNLNFIIGGKKVAQLGLFGGDTILIFYHKVASPGNVIKLWNWHI